MNVDKDWYFKCGEFRRDVRLEILLFYIMFGCYLYNGCYFFVEYFVWYVDNGGVYYGGMVIECVFDFDIVDVFVVVNKYVFGLVENEYKVVFVYMVKIVVV